MFCSPPKDTAEKKGKYMDCLYSWRWFPGNHRSFWTSICLKKRMVCFFVRVPVSGLKGKPKGNPVFLFREGPTHKKTRTHTQTHRHTDTQTHRHTDTQTHRHTDTQRNTQRHTHTHTHKDTHIHAYLHVSLFKPLAFLGSPPNSGGTYHLFPLGQVVSKNP